jgi:hypothetical protein
MEPPWVTGQAMISIEFDMWPGAEKILLRDVLERLSFACSVNWTLYEFRGSGVAPDGGGMAEFERKLLESSTELSFSTDRVAKFASDITDITDITLAGFCADRKIIEIVGFDSGSWEITADEDSVDVTKLCASYALEVRTLGTDE